MGVSCSRAVPRTARGAGHALSSARQPPRLDVGSHLVMIAAAVLVPGAGPHPADQHRHLPDHDLQLPSLLSSAGVHKSRRCRAVAGVEQPTPGAEVARAHLSRSAGIGGGPGSRGCRLDHGQDQRTEDADGDIDDHGAPQFPRSPPLRETAPPSAQPACVPAPPPPMGPRDHRSNRHPRRQGDPGSVVGRASASSGRGSTSDTPSITFR